MKQLFIIDDRTDILVDFFYYGEDGKIEVALNCVGEEFLISHNEEIEKFPTLSQALKRMSELVP